METVSLIKDESIEYPLRSPFHPSEKFPEHSNVFKINISSQEDNKVYRSVRNLFYLYGLDKANYGKSNWNPLGKYIQQGNKIMIKPNWVQEERGKYLGTRSVTTDGSVLRVMIDYVFLAAGRNGKITIADAPIQSSNLDKMLIQSGVSEIIKYYRQELGFEIEIFDMRKIKVEYSEEDHYLSSPIQLAGDPLGYSEINLGNESFLEEITFGGTKFGVSDYSTEETKRRHSQGNHTYVVSKSVLDADVFINMPKMKTHQKMGVTLALKNLVGIIGDKSCLPHFRVGGPQKGGDELSVDTYVENVKSKMRVFTQGKSRILWKAIRSIWLLYKKIALKNKDYQIAGAWNGNDTIWRMVYDINNILFHYDGQGKFNKTKQFRYLTLIDGIWGGEGDGPLKHDPKHSGILLFADDPICADLVASEIMGFSRKEIPLLSNYEKLGQRIGCFSSDISEINIMSNIPGLSKIEELRNYSDKFIRPPGFKL